MTNTQAKHGIAASEPGTQIAHYISRLLSLMTYRDWERYGTEVTLTRISKVPNRMRNRPRQYAIGRRQALIMKFPRNNMIGLTPDGALRDVMPAFDSNRTGYYESYKVIKIGRMSAADKRLLERGLKKWIQKIESQA